MFISQVTTILPSISLLSALVLGFPAHANSSSNAGQLLPLESRSVAVEVDPSLHEAAANEINEFDPSQSESSGLTDVLDAGLFEGLIDENGEMDLPMGITVFDSMGAASVGFGGDF